jgi:hypothetical protein
MSVDRNKPIFGAGPHFAAVPCENSKLPGSILQITYNEGPLKDHRSAIEVVDIIRASKEVSDVVVSSPEPPERKLRIWNSSYYISEFVPPGTWIASQNMMAENQSGARINVLVGQGFTNEELPSKVSTALHDLVVGLICFDVVYFPLTELGKVHAFLGEHWFWAMCNSGAVEFVHLGRQGAVLFENSSRQDGGDFGMVGRSNLDGSMLNVHDSIRMQIRPVAGREAIADPQS